MADELLDTGWTGTEIRQQPGVWRAVAQAVDTARAAVDRLLGEALADPSLRVVLTGAGTSAYAGQVLAPDLSRRLGRAVEAIATTDIVADPRSILTDDRPVLLVSFARSGNSPESLAAVDLVSDLARAPRHLVITCNADGGLARRFDDATDDATDGGTDEGAAKQAAVVTLPARAHDRGFAMTSSFTGMIVAALLCFAPGLDVDAIADSGEGVLARAGDIADAVTDLAPSRWVHLGSAALGGLAREGALKCLELTAGRVVAIADTPLAFRHGPKSVLDGDTAAVVYLSGDPYTRAYDEDIVRELAGALGGDRVVVVGDPDDLRVFAAEGVRCWPVVRPAGASDALWAVAAVIPAQIAALAGSVAAGCTPDNPFPDGEVNRVVQGVTIHPFAPSGR